MHYIKYQTDIISTGAYCSLDKDRVAVFGGCSVWELYCVCWRPQELPCAGVAMFLSCHVPKLPCVGVAVSGSHKVWKL